MNKGRFFLFAILLYSCVMTAQDIKIVEANYTYYSPPNLSLLEAKTEAIKRAQIEAIGASFGFIVTSNNFMGMDNNNGQSHLLFSQLSESEVKGEWLRDLEEPKVVNIIPMNDMTISITVHVKGEAREIISSSINYKVKILKNGQDDAFESDDFKVEDRFYMSFCSPVNGYLAIYMLDDDGNAWRLLPYANSSDPSFKIEQDRQYFLFSEQQDGWGIRMTCDKEMDFNHIYTIFSPNKFTRTLDSGIIEKDDGIVLPPKLSLKDFQQWLVRIRKHDKELTVNRKTIKVKK